MCCCGLKVILDLINRSEIVEWAAYLCGIKTGGKKDRTHSEMCFFCGSKSNALVVNCWISHQNIQNDYIKIIKYYINIRGRNSWVVVK